MTIGNKIRILRQGRNMTQKELAEKSGLAEITIGQYEADKFKPKPEQIEKLAAGLNVPSSQINTENFWINAEGNTAVQIPGWLDKDFSFGALKKEKEKNLDFAIKVIKKRDFQSDIIVDLIKILTSMNPDGISKAYEYIGAIAELPKYQREHSQKSENE